MQKKNMFASMLAAIALLALSTLAHANQYQLNASGTNTASNPFSLSALLTTDDTPINVGGYQGLVVTGISGTWTNGSIVSSITGLLSNVPLEFTLDNGLITSPYGFDNAGLGFQAGGLDLNLYSVGNISSNAQYYLSIYGGGSSYNPGDAVSSLTITPTESTSNVPDGGSTVLMFTGALGLLGFISKKALITSIFA